MKTKVNKFIFISSFVVTALFCDSAFPILVPTTHAGDSCRRLVTPRHMSSTPYKGQYPDLIAFQKPREFTTQVSQGNFVEVSGKDKPILSEGFSLCWAFLLRNRKTGRVTFFHVQLEFDSRADEYLRSIQASDYESILIKGTESAVLETQALEKLGFSPSLIEIPTGRTTWSVMYDPVSNQIYFDQRSQKSLIMLDGF